MLRTRRNAIVSSRSSIWKGLASIIPPTELTKSLIFGLPRCPVMKTKRSQRCGRMRSTARKNMSPGSVGIIMSQRITSKSAAITMWTPWTPFSTAVTS